MAGSNYQVEDGNYIATTEQCVRCQAGVEITPAHRTDGDGPWCACCSAVLCQACWDAAGSECACCSGVFCQACWEAPGTGFCPLCYPTL